MSMFVIPAVHRCTRGFRDCRATASAASTPFALARLLFGASVFAGACAETAAPDLLAGAVRPHDITTFNSNRSLAGDDSPPTWPGHSSPLDKTVGGATFVSTSTTTTWASLLDEVSEGLRDAVNEAAVTLLVFLFGAVLISKSKRRFLDKQRVARANRKLENIVMAPPRSKQSNPTADSRGAGAVAPQVSKCHRTGDQKIPFSTATASRTTAQNLHNRKVEVEARHSGAQRVKEVSNPNGLVQSQGNSLASAVRWGRASELPRLLRGAKERLQQRQISGQVLDDCMRDLLVIAVRACASSRCFQEGLATYDDAAKTWPALLENRTSEKLWSVLLYVAVEAGEFERCEGFYERLRTTAGEPSVNDLVNLVRALARWGDHGAIQAALADLHVVNSKSLDGFSRNRVVAACCAEGASEVAMKIFDSDVFGTSPDVVTYNTLMKGFARQGKLHRCLELWDEMRKRGLAASDVTFGILLEACLSGEDFNKADAICNEMISSGLHLNAVHYTSFVKGLVHAGRLSEAANLLEHMEKSPNTRPDIITYSTLVKAYAERGDATSAASVVVRMVSRGIVPDEIIFNSALGACFAKTGTCCSSEQVLKIFEDFLNHGLVPSTATISILLKALSLHRDWVACFGLLDSLPRRFRLIPQTRLYAQLTQAAMREGCEDVAMDVVDKMCRSATTHGEKLDEAIRTRLLRCAVSCGQALVAEQLRDAAPPRCQ